jgi:hypothetical protein
LKTSNQKIAALTAPTQDQRLDLQRVLARRLSRGDGGAGIVAAAASSRAPLLLLPRFFFRSFLQDLFYELEAGVKVLCCFFVFRRAVRTTFLSAKCGGFAACGALCAPAG